MNTVQALDLMHAKAQQLCPGWATDNDNLQVVTAAAAWLAREPRQGFDLNKGLLLIGNVGTGKTMLMRIVREAMREAYGSQFGIRSCQELVRTFADEGYDGIEDWMKGPHVCFDDLGAEHTGAHYAVKTNLMAEVIEARYERLTSGKKCWTHFTTNLGTDKLRGHVGERAYSRLRHMCNVLDLGASSAAIDRRASAVGVAPPEIPPSADNVYTVVHPKIAARLQEALAPAVAALKAEQAPKMSVVRAETGQGADLERFAQMCSGASVENLQSERKAILLNNTPGASAPFVAIIDAELSRIHNAAEVVVPLEAPSDQKTAKENAA